VAELLATVAVALKQKPLKAARDQALLLLGWAGACVEVKLSPCKLKTFKTLMVALPY
jgi:hypothetical protein